MTGDCRHCQGWKQCTQNGDWFSYSDIRFCALQTFFLLKHADILHSGIWPIAEITVAPGIRGKTMNTEASFTKASRIIAEVDVRLQSTGWRGRLLSEECVNREKMGYLSDDTKAVLFYISGWRRKEMPFYQWRWQRRRRKNEDKNIIKKEVETVASS